MPTATEIKLEDFINRSQLACMRSLARTGEESEHWRDKIADILKKITETPGMYTQENEADPLCHLHYFHAGSDWYILELDKDEPGYAFGFVCLNGWTQDAELGYIDIKNELLPIGIEIDLHFERTPLSKIREKLGCL